MKINTINNQYVNTNFTALKKIKPHISYGEFSTDEQMIANKLKQYAVESDFFKKHNVNAVVYSKFRQAVIHLSYRDSLEKGTSLIKRIKNIIKPEPAKECVIVSSDQYCTMEAAYKLAKKLRESTKEHSLDTIIENNKRIDIEKLQVK